MIGLHFDMGVLKLDYIMDLQSRGSTFRIETAKLNRFDQSLLGFRCGRRSEENFDALAAIFDLEGFTSFCQQNDPYLVMPGFLDEFLAWVFKSIFEHSVVERKEGETTLCGPLPFYAKFLGDGVLFLWNISLSNNPSLVIGKIVSILRRICEDYKVTFVPSVGQSCNGEPPETLRCGVARGQIFSIAKDEEYIGPCINIAARIQKLKDFSFAFSNKTLDSDSCFGNQKEDFTKIRTEIRDVGEKELLYVLTQEFGELDGEEQMKLRVT
jgi:class 3 adenylate cyclase